MKNLLLEVEALANVEYFRAGWSHPLFASDHEGLAVIAEEIREAIDEYNDVRARFKKLAGFVFDDNDNPAFIETSALEQSAIRCAAEMIQAAAMCRKFRESQDARVVNNVDSE